MPDEQHGLSESFIDKLFTFVGESNSKNIKSIDKLTEQISSLASSVEVISSTDLVRLKENCDKILDIVIELKEWDVRYEPGLKIMNQFELGKFRKDQEEKLKILRWLSMKFKIVIAISTLFFFLTGGSYIIVKYFNAGDHITLVDTIKEENKKLREEISIENEKLREEISSDNDRLKRDILKKMKKIHPNLIIEE